MREKVNWGNIETVEIPVSILKRLIGVGEQASQWAGFDCRDTLAETAAEYALGEVDDSEIVDVVTEMSQNPYLRFEADDNSFFVHLLSTGENPALKKFTFSSRGFRFTHRVPFSFYMSAVNALRVNGYSPENGSIFIQGEQELTRLSSLYDHVQVDTYLFSHMEDGIEISILDIWND